MTKKTRSQSTNFAELVTPKLHEILHQSYAQGFKIEKHLTDDNAWYLTDDNAWYLPDNLLVPKIQEAEAMRVLMAGNAWGKSMKVHKRASAKFIPAPNPFKVPVDPIQKAIDDAVQSIGNPKGYEDGQKG